MKTAQRMTRIANSQVVDGTGAPAVVVNLVESRHVGSIGVVNLVMSLIQTTESTVAR